MTLTEVLIVLGVLGALSAVAVPMVATWSRGSRAREAARIVQAAMIGARERAIGVVCDKAQTRFRHVRFFRLRAKHIDRAL